MRQAPDETTQPGVGRMWQVWRSGLYIGADRPMGRATVQVVEMKHQSTGNGRWGNLQFNQAGVERELPNLKSIKWERSVDQDAATCTIELWNTRPLEIGEVPTDADLDTPGWYTPNRGRQGAYNRWGYAQNEWAGILVENRVICTYEGYGVNPLVAPRADTNLMQTGAWLIDKVELRSDKTIRITCRDYAKPLLEQIAYPPVVPLAHYPLQFEARRQVPDPRQMITVKNDGETIVAQATYDRDSNFPYVGEGGKLMGHRGRDAFDGSLHSYWLSVGNSDKREPFAYEWVQAKVPGTQVSGVRFVPWAGNYTVYVSVMVNGKWQGSQTIPYAPKNNIGLNQSDIKYVKRSTCGFEKESQVIFDQPYQGVQKVRITFGNLYDSNMGQFHFRAGLRDFDVVQVFGGQAMSVLGPQTYHTEGNYDDYTHIVAQLCAYGGFFWPDTGSTTWHGQAYEPDPSPEGDPAKTSSVVGRPHRVFGDFELSGTAGPVPLSADIFDKKPLMDGIVYIRDILGYVFWVDEHGRPLFRSPNIWKVGNTYYPRLLPTPQRVQPKRVNYIPEIDERIQLTDLSVTLDDRNGRSEVYVSSTDGRTAAGTKGREPNPMGLERVSIWSDQGFETKRECQIMADLIALRQLFTYRTDTATIPGNPCLQIDDQVRIWERTTGEVYIHYIRGMTSTNEIGSEEGWTMSLQTTWLGERPEDLWLFGRDQFSLPTVDFLRAQGKIA